MLNEHDLADFDVSWPPAPLYTVPRKNYICWLEKLYWFDHLDGMYSYCLDAAQNVVNIPAAAHVNLCKKKETK